MSAELVDATSTVRSAFAERFGGQPEGLWVAPARVNLIGEHTDYNDGWVLPLAIDRRVTVAAARRSGGLLRLLSLQRGEQVLRLAEVRPGAMNGWAAYVAGAVWSLAQEGTKLDGLDLVLTGDIPVGSGLSSSAAVECATLLAARDLYGGPDDRARLALVAQRAENEVVGVPCGIMDQMAAMACTANHALLLDCRSLAAEHIPLALDAVDLVLLVIDTRVAHALADSAYDDRRRTCQEAARVLGVPSLRDVTDAAVETARDRLGGVHYRRARHVVRENARVLAVVELLRRGQPERIGPPLTASHASLRDDYAVSAPELDTAVEATLAAGALGARMTGAGFGGCALALVPAGAAEQVAEAVTATFAAREFGPPEIFPAHPMDGARRLA